MHEQDYALAQTQATQLEVSKVLRNTYGLLALTLAFSGLVAYVAMQMNAVYPNIFVVLIAFWFARAWRLARRGAIDGDPVAFALRDGASYAVLAATGVALYAAA